MDKSTNIDPTKIFVGGLSWDTNQDSLTTHFSQYGTVTDSVIMIDQMTKRPRGFGFVTFESEESVLQALAVKDHTLDGKKVDPKHATAKNNGGGQSDAAVKKIFVGGLPTGIEDHEVEQYFMNYGKVTDVDLKTDKSTGRKRGFGFVTFETEDAVEAVIRKHFHTIKDKAVETKKAEPRVPTNQGSYQQGAVANYKAGYAQAPSHSSYSGGYPAAAYQQSYGQQSQQDYYQSYPTGYPAANYYAGSSGGYNQADQSYAGSGQQVTPSQQMPAYTTNAHSYGASSSRTGSGYSAASDSYASGSYNYPEGAASAQYSSRNATSFSHNQQNYDYS